MAVAVSATSAPPLHAQQPKLPSSPHDLPDSPWVKAAAAAVMSAARMADPPPGDPALEDTAFLYAANMHNAIEALPETEYQTAYLQSDWVNPANILEDINVDDNETSQVLKLIAEVARIHHSTHLPVERTIGPCAGMSRLSERMIETLKNKRDDIEKDMVLEKQAVIEADCLISDIEKCFCNYIGC